MGLISVSVNGKITDYYQPLFYVNTAKPFTFLHPICFDKKLFSFWHFTF